MAMPDSEQREFPRESIELVVRYQRLNAFFADYVKNISRGGTFVATAEPLPPDTEFVFSLGVPQMEDPIQLRAKVMWVTSPDVESAANPAGMGIQFQYQDAEERGRLERLIEQLIVDQLGQRHADFMLGRSARPDH
jgi:type IV pilus assembly protein PilZ